MDELKERQLFLESRIAQLMTEAEHLDQEIMDAELELESVEAQISIRN